MGSQPQPIVDCRGPKTDAPTVIREAGAFGASADWDLVQGWVLDAVGGSHDSPLGRDRSYVLAAVRWLQTPGLKAAEACTDPAFKR